MEGLEETYLSKDALSSLGSISKDFPWIMVMNNDQVEYGMEHKHPWKIRTPESPKLSRPIKVDEPKQNLPSNYKSSTTNTSSDQPFTPTQELLAELHKDVRSSIYYIHGDLDHTHWHDNT